MCDYKDELDDTTPLDRNDPASVVEQTLGRSEMPEKGERDFEEKRETLGADENMQKFFVSRHFKNLKSHSVKVNGEYGMYDIILEPLGGA